MPLPDHVDPDFENLTYGEPWGRIDKLDVGDIAFFIESATKDEWKTWSYFVIAYFVVEMVYRYKSGKWFPGSISESDQFRIDNNAHALRRDDHYSILLGDKSSSKLLFQSPFRLSEKQTPTSENVQALRLGRDKELTGYWWKKWFDEKSTFRLLELISGSTTQGITNDGKVAPFL